MKYGKLILKNAVTRYKKGTKIFPIETGDEDDTVYRAKVLSVEGDNVTVRCIDYGYTHSLPMKNIYKLKQVQ